MHQVADNRVGVTDLLPVVSKVFPEPEGGIVEDAQDAASQHREVGQLLVVQFGVDRADHGVEVDAELVGFGVLQLWEVHVVRLAA